MIKQIVESLTDTVRGKVIEEFLACETLQDVKKVKEKYRLEFTDEMLEYMEKLGSLPVLSEEEQEYVAGGKTNFLLNGQGAYKGRL